MCVCERERERERKRGGGGEKLVVCVNTMCIKVRLVHTYS